MRRKATDAPACLVLDVRLPGSSGLDLQRELAAANSHIPVIFITGHGDIPMSVRAMKAGAAEFLTKPFRDQDLLDAIQQAIERDCEASTLIAKPASSVASLTRFRLNSKMSQIKPRYNRSPVVPGLVCQP